MKVTHEFELQAKCPVDDSRDIYHCSIEIGRMLKCEEIIESARRIATAEAIFQEDLTQAIANRIGGKTTTVGLHKCGVKTTVVCEPTIESKAPIFPVTK